MRVRAERSASLPRSARTLTPTPLPEGEGLYVELRTDATVIPQSSRWSPSPRGSTRGGHKDVPGFEERGRWRQPDEGAGEAVRITLALRPYPHPHPSPGGRGAPRCGTPKRCDCFPQPSRWNPSPSGRRWRQPDEGAGEAVRITLALRPYPHPSLSRRRGALYVALRKSPSRKSTRVQCRIHCCGARPLSVHSCSCVPCVVEPAGSSRISEPEAWFSSL